MRSRKRVIIDRGASAAGWLGGEVLPAVRRQLDLWRDPRARHLRRRRRAGRVTAGSGAATGAFGLAAFGSTTVELEFVQYTGAVGFGGLALFSGVAAIGAGVRYRRLRRQPVPEAAPRPVELPPEASAAHDPMRRLRDAEWSLHRTLDKLRSADVAADRGVVIDVHGTAEATAAELREGADRLVAVESALEHVPVGERDQLGSDVARLQTELDRGVAEYGKLVAAAGRALAARNVSEQHTLLRDATDRLGGLAEAWRDVLGTTRRSEGNVPREAGASLPERSGVDQGGVARGDGRRGKRRRKQRE